MVLAHVKKIAEAFLGRPMPQAIISVPAYYNDNQRHAVKEAGAPGRLRGEAHRQRAHRRGAGLRLQPRARPEGPGLRPGRRHLRRLGAPAPAERLRGAGHRRRHLPGRRRLRQPDHRLGARPVLAGAQGGPGPVAHRAAAGEERRPRRPRSTSPSSPTPSIDLPFVEERRGKPLDLRMPISRQQLDELTRDLVDRSFQLCDEVLEQKGHLPELHRRDHPGGRPEPDAARAAADPRALRQAAAQGGPPRRVRGAGRGAARRLARQHRLGDPGGRALHAHRHRRRPTTGCAGAREEPAPSRRRAASGCRRRASRASPSRSTSTRATATRSWTTSSSARCASPPPPPGGASTSSSTRSACCG